jgi:hypothetical protein
MGLCTLFEDAFYGHYGVIRMGRLAASANTAIPTPTLQGVNHHKRPARTQEPTHLIESMATTNVNTMLPAMTPTICQEWPVNPSSGQASMVQNTAAPNMIGGASANDSATASVLGRPHLRPATMVNPDRDNPGITAIPCVSPTIMAARQVKPGKSPEGVAGSARGAAESAKPLSSMEVPTIHALLPVWWVDSHQRARPNGAATAPVTPRAAR